jgi:hypothetical protein
MKVTGSPSAFVSVSQATLLDVSAAQAVSKVVLP